MKVGKRAVAAAFTMILVVGVHAARAQNANLSNATCLSCHGQPGFSTKLANGQMRSLFVSSDHFGHSVHGTLACTACHTTITELDFGLFMRRERVHFPFGSRYGAEFLYCLCSAGT